ncbi:hypothetical protein GCM10010286_59440 [Streptomyces toxytricini]|nr:hypothetical protein GCM10010286_59440 [Streptomyces toxytricini]
MAGSFRIAVRGWRCLPPLGGRLPAVHLGEQAAYGSVQRGRTQPHGGETLAQQRAVKRVGSRR